MPDLQRYLDIRSAGGGRLTADGETLVYITNVTGLPQAWSMPLGGGWPTQLTFADQRIGGVAPSPTDASLIVFSRDDGGNERMQLHTVRPTGFDERDLVVDPDVIHRFGEFGPDGTWFVFCDNRRNGVDFDLYHRTLEGDERLVAELDGWNSVADVSPDGSRALVGHFVSNMDSTLWLVDLETGDVADLTAHEEPALHAPVGFTEEGDILFVSDRDDEFRRAHRLHDGQIESFGPDADVDGLVVEHGAAAIAWNDHGRTRAAWVHPITMAVGDEIELPLGVAGGFRIAPDGSRMLFTMSASAGPGDVWQIEVGDVTPSRVTLRGSIRRSSSNLRSRWSPPSTDSRCRSGCTGPRMSITLR
jgi:hypothetical protein